jgi:hypothetical protein
LLCRCISSVNGGGSTPGNPAHPIKTSAKIAKANNILTSFFIPCTLFHFARKNQNAMKIKEGGEMNPPFL